MQFLKLTTRNLSQPKIGQNYLHKKLGYMGKMVYNFESKSSFIDSETNQPEYKKVDMCLGLFLKGKDCTRARMSKHMNTIMIHMNQQMIGPQNKETLSENPLKTSANTANLVNVALSGLDILESSNIQPIQNKLTQADSPLKSVFFDEDLAHPENLNPNTDNIDTWKENFSMKFDKSYNLKFLFKNDNLEVEIFLYPYDNSSLMRVGERVIDENSDEPLEILYRYRVNFILTKTPDKSNLLTVGPVIWKLKCYKDEKEQAEKAADTSANKFYDFKVHQSPNNPVKLNYIKKSAQYCGDLKLNNVNKFYEIEPLLVARWENLNEEDIPENSNFEILDYGLNNTPMKDMVNEGKYNLNRAYPFPAFRVDI